MTKREQLAALAEFAGGETVGHLWRFRTKTKGEPICHYEAKRPWNPYSNPAHMMLVLEALVKHEQQRLSIMHGPQSWGGMGWDHVLCSLKSRVFHKWDEPFDFASAVNSMALEVMATNTKGETK